MTLLREDLLQARAVALSRGVPGSVARALADHGARVKRMPERADSADDQVGEWAREQGELSVLVYDAAPTFGAGGLEALTATMEEAWVAIREVAVGALIEAAAPGKIVLLGPPTGAGGHAEAAAAALENLARTLSVEWARHGVTTVLVARGGESSEVELAEVVCFLCSVAGDYFTGCRLDLG